MKSRTGNCTICTVYTTGLNMHHTIPRACGGEHSIQIPLCGTCHEILHKKADAHLAALKRGAPPPTQSFWVKPEDEARAEYWFAVLLTAITKKHYEGNIDSVLLSGITVSLSTRDSLDVLAKDIGSENIKTTLEYCIAYTLNGKGITNGKTNNRQDNKLLKKRPKKPSDLW